MGIPKASILLVGASIALVICFASSRSIAGEIPQDAQPTGLGKVPSGYEIFQSVPLKREVNGITGQLQILQDERVTDDYRDAWGISNDPNMALTGTEPGGESDHSLKDIQKNPLRHGLLRLVREDGKALFEEKFDVYLGKIETAFLYGTKFPSYLIWEDYGIGMGSYAGPAMHLVEVRSGKLIHVQAATETGEKVAVSYSISLKNGGRVVASPDGAQKEIQKVQCHPNFDNPEWSDHSEFVVDYSTYRFYGNEWHYVTRREIGYFENEGDDETWPDRSKFP